jgi:hypothetical protein
MKRHSHQGVAFVEVCNAWPQTPLRVLCTGYRSGGGYAELCGVWAAATYPQANIRTITFGAPQVWTEVSLKYLEFLFILLNLEA